MDHLYRNELKYEIKRNDFMRLKDRLACVMALDKHGQKGCYHVRSCYFEDAYDRSLNENLMGLAIRSKYRLRMYDFNDSYLLLERKAKYFDKGIKEQLVLSIEEANHLLQGDYGFLRYRNESISVEFHSDFQRYLLKPCLIVDYQRDAFETSAGNVRVTLDTNLKTSTAIHGFFNKQLVMMPQRVGKCLLEVKYDRFIPDFIQSVVNPFNPQRIAHSKYVIGRLAQR